ncbi:unnamed protein product [Choristocarpus tenellus]
MASHHPTSSGRTSCTSTHMRRCPCRGQHQGVSDWGVVGGDPMVLQIRNQENKQGNVECLGLVGSSVAAALSPCVGGRRQEHAGGGSSQWDEEERGWPPQACLEDFLKEVHETQTYALLGVDTITEFAHALAAERIEVSRLISVAARA